MRLAAGVVLLLALAAGCRATPRDPGTIVVAIAVSPTNLDPRVGVDEASQRVHQLLYGQLVKLDARLQVVPDVAESLDLVDPTTYVARLRHGVRFHHGVELTADDVVCTFGSLIDPDFVSPRKGAYRPLASVTAVDRYTVRFTLKQPFASFPINLVMGIVPCGVPNLARAPVGSGPYRFERMLQDDRVELARFDGYFGEPARNTRLVLKVVPDDTMRGLELRKGGVDLVVNDLAPDLVFALKHDAALAVSESPGADFAYVGMNLKDPALRNVLVRRALGYAIDRAAIVAHLRRGLARPAVGVLPPMSWAFEPDVFEFTHDTARARALLDEAGLRDPDGEGPQPRLRLTLKTSTAEFARLQATVIQRQLAEAGIAVDVRTQEFATLLADVLKGRFQLVTLQWVGVSDPDMLRRVFHSSQMPPVGFNRGFFSDAVVDGLIDAASRETDVERRRRLYGDAQQRIAEAAPYISLWYKTNVAVYRRDLRHVVLSPTADFSFLARVERAMPAAR